MSFTYKWGTRIPPDELAELYQARNEFRDLWATIKPPWESAMDGDVTDIRAIDYLHYEGIGFPPCGVWGASLITAEIVRRAAKFDWVRAYDGELYLADEPFSNVVICPRARLEEIQLALVPQFSRFAHFAIRASIDCFGLDGEADESLRQLMAELDDGEMESMSAKLSQIRKHGQ